MKNIDPLMPDKYYHVYNRAVSNDRLFTHEEEYLHFLNLWRQRVSPLAHTYAYCLLPNHFHFMIRMKSEIEMCKSLKINEFKHITVSRIFAALFCSYANTFNNRHDRMGKLFMLPFRRKEIKSDQYFSQLVYYIHRNPLHHNLEKNPTRWPYASYSAIISDQPTWLHRSAVLDWFGGVEGFKQYHSYMMNLSG